jgi:hypothetical protein
MADEAQQPTEETHVVADDSDDPEHVDDCPGCEAFTLTGHIAEAQQPETRAIQCADAFWDGQPHAPHDWQQRPDAQPVRCPGIGEAQQPKEA